MNLISFDIDDFDATLGMGCLPEYRTTTNYSNKKMMTIISKKNWGETIFHGERQVFPMRLICVMIARRMCKMGIKVCNCVYR